MNKDRLQKEMDYSVAMHIWKEMLEAGIIDRQDLIHIDKLYIDRYCPIFRSVTAINNVKVETQSLNGLESKPSPK